MRLLIIEDEPDMLDTLSEAMRAEGYAVDGAADGEDGLHKAQDTEYDAIICDVMLPVFDGFEVVRRLRKSKKTPVLMLTARTKIPDRILGLDSGADDYLAKPIDLLELAARVRALIRRSLGNATPILEIGNVQMDTTAQTVSLDGQPVVLTAHEYALLEFMVQRRGRIVTRTQLHEHLYDETESPMSNSLDVLVLRLRKKIGTDFIITHRGRGYTIP